MSKVSPHTEHLIRAAMRSIKDKPELWHQDTWASRTSCGTAFCMGGWIATHDGWTHGFGTWGNEWRKGDRILDNNDIFGKILRPLMPEIYDSMVFVSDTMFGTQPNTVEKLEAKIVQDAGIDFSKPCTCVAGLTDCPKPCPCGHAEPAVIKDSFGDVVRMFVQACQGAGDRITERQVLADPILMQAFRNFEALGDAEAFERLYRQQQKNILEAHQELVRMTQSRDRAVENNSQLVKEIKDLQADKVRLGRDQVEKGSVIRKLQGQIDDLKMHRSKNSEMRKLRAKLAHASQLLKEAERVMEADG